MYNNLRFSFCLRCYLHVQTTAFSGENMHESRKESLLCIFAMRKKESANREFLSDIFRFVFDHLDVCIICAQYSVGLV